jgi:hypothetical protein
MCFLFSFPATHDFLHQIAGPARIYYRITRWLFGKNYNPFETSVNEEIHPISSFIIDNYESIRLFFDILPSMIPVVAMVIVIYLTQRHFLHGTNDDYFNVSC